MPLLSPALPQAHPTPPARLDFLDGLRGLAALGVVAHHFTAAFYPTSMTGDGATTHLPGTWEADFAASPLHVLLNFRVCFFFVLSGLVLAESAGRLPRGWRTLAAQLVRRYVRLGAPVAVSTALAFGLLRGQWFYNQPAAAASGAGWFASFWHWVPGFEQFATDALWGVMLRGQASYNPVVWTMVVEWNGSVLVLALLALLGGWRWRLLAYAALALAFTLGRLNFYYVAFLLGLGLHDVYRRDWASQLRPIWRRLLIAALLLAALVAASKPQIFYHAPKAGSTYDWMRLPGVSPDRTVQFYHTIGAVALLAAVLLSARLRRLTDVNLLRRVGKRAFSLYLTHFLWLGSGASALFLALRPYFSYHVSFGLMVLGTVAVLVPTTNLFYRYVDVPSHKLARWLSQRILGNPFGSNSEARATTIHPAKPERQY